MLLQHQEEHGFLLDTSKHIFKFPPEIWTAEVIQIHSQSILSICRKLFSFV